MFLKGKPLLYSAMMSPILSLIGMICWTSEPPPHGNDVRWIGGILLVLGQFVLSACLIAIVYALHQPKYRHGKWTGD